MGYFVMLVVVATLTASNTLAQPPVAQRANIHSNTPRGGIDVTQVPGRKIGTVTTIGNLIHRNSMKARGRAFQQDHTPPPGGGAR